MVNEQLDGAYLELNMLLGDCTYLETLRYDNDDWTLWRDKVRDTLELEFGDSSEEYKRFRGPGSAIIPTNDPQRQEQYLRVLSAYERNLKSILQRLELRQKQFTPASHLQATAQSCPCVFIAHGGQSEERDYLELFLWGSGYRPAIVEELTSRGMHPDAKVDFYMERCQFGVIFAEADRAAVQDNKLYPRLNIIDEMVRIRKTLGNKFTLLLEEGLSLNSDEQVTWHSFTKDTIDKACHSVVKELEAHGFHGADALGEHAE